MRHKQRNWHRKRESILDIPTKANRVLNIILVAMVFVALRIWHLGVVQYETKLEESKKPQRRVIVEPSKRGTIRDRFNIPLAINQVTYQVGILYSQIKQIPSFKWGQNELGKRVKIFKRREYIKQLSTLLGTELDLDPDRIEDLIHAKGPFYYNMPLVIKEELTEHEYYRLKMLEKDWLGIQVQRMPKRHYPYQKVAGDIIGYIGSINREEYESILHEIKSLQDYIDEYEQGSEEPDLPAGMSSPLQAKNRLIELQERAYSITDQVGKTGIEGRFEEDLRGFHGKKAYYSDARGNFLRLLSGSRDPLSGKRVLLSLSIELQEYAENLLIQNERIRETRITLPEKNTKKTILSLKEPWIKGGAIVAMDPNTGEVLALASHPRFDPNDFIVSGNSETNKEKRSHIRQWFEQESFLAEVWDLKRPLTREVYDQEQKEFTTDSLMMTWENYLKMILPPDHPVTRALYSLENIRDIIAFQQHVEQLLELSGQPNLYVLFNHLYCDEDHESHGPKLSVLVKEALEANLKVHAKEVKRLKRKIDPYFEEMTLCYDKVLLVDLCRLTVNGDLFNPELLVLTGKQSLSHYRQASGSYAIIYETVHQMAKELFHEIFFKQWIKENEKDFLKQKRLEEKLAHKYPKPYIDHFDSKENELFQEFWAQNQWSLLLAFLKGNSFGYAESSELMPYLDYFDAWHQEIEQGAHQSLYWMPSYQTLNHAIHVLRYEQAIEYCLTLRRFQDLDRPLLGKYRHLRQQNKQQLEKHLAAAFYPTYGYGYGRSHGYRQAAVQGSIFKLVTAYAALVQRYHELNGKGISSVSLNPLEIHDKVFKNGKEVCVGYTMDGKPLPRLYKGGRLPRSSSQNIGHLDIVKAIQWSSNPYFSVLAGDYLNDPNDLLEAARLFSFGSRTGINLPGEIEGKLPTDLHSNQTGLYAMAIGQHTLVVTPLQTATMLCAIANGGKVFTPKIVSYIAGKQLHNNDDDNFYNFVTPISAIIKRDLFMPNVIKNMLLEGMRLVVAKTYESGIFQLSKLYKNHPEAISDFIEMKEQMVGKTSTAEAVENIDLDVVHGTPLCTHLWFGGISYEQDSSGKAGEHYLFRDQYGRPELVVVVYLRYGNFGKEAAPLAAQVVKKWRELKRQAS